MVQQHNVSYLISQLIGGDTARLTKSGDAPVFACLGLSRRLTASKLSITNLPRPSSQHQRLLECPCITTLPHLKPPGRRFANSRLSLTTVASFEAKPPNTAIIPRCHHGVS